MKLSCFQTGELPPGFQPHTTYLQSGETDWGGCISGSLGDVGYIHTYPPWYVYNLWSLCCRLTRCVCIFHLGTLRFIGWKSSSHQASSLRYDFGCPLRCVTLPVLILRQWWSLSDLVSFTFCTRCLCMSSFISVRNQPVSNKILKTHNEFHFNCKKENHSPWAGTRLLNNY